LSDEEVEDGKRMIRKARRLRQSRGDIESSGAPITLSVHGQFKPMRDSLLSDQDSNQWTDNNGRL